MEKPSKQLQKLTFTKKLVCVSCKYEPLPTDLGKPCPNCGSRYDLVDKVQERRPFAQDRRQHGGI